MFQLPERNEPCWCESGKKFKKCHLDREKEKPLSRQDLELQTKKHTQVCCASSLNDGLCTKKIIQAHTISKSGSLKQIAEGGHVMGVKTSLSELDRTGGDMDVKKVGIKDASTFAGFCSYHDKELFAPLEDQAITLSTEQLFLLAYRSTSRELYAKNEQLLTVEFSKSADRGMPIHFQRFIQQKAKLEEKGINLALSELNAIKAELDAILLNRNFEDLNHFVIECSDIPDILVSGSTQPEFDFSGARLQRFGLKGGALSHLIYNAISYDNKGCFVFSWTNSHNDICRRFIDSLTNLDTTEISTALVKYCYTYCENTWASPTWWDALDESQAKEIRRRVQIHSLNPARSQDLMPDAFKFDAYKIHKTWLHQSPKLTSSPSIK